MSENEIRAVQAQAQLLVDSFIMSHGSAGIAALLGACTLWSVEHGAVELIKRSLDNAKTLADNLQAARLRGGS
jgi:hypothetical protein